MKKEGYSFDDFSDGASDQDYKKATDEAEEISSIIRTLIRSRIRQGMTQRDLAKKANIPQSTVGRIEKLNVSPKLDTVISLAYCLGIKIFAKENFEIDTPTDITYTK